MLLRFTKMHGLGNDFIVFDGVSQDVKLNSDQIQKLADRHFGIGCDQVLLVEPPAEPGVDFNYRIFNRDGGEVEQCGNGIRCFAKFVTDKKLCGKNTIRVSTMSGIAEVSMRGGKLVRVNMGVPEFAPERIPLNRDSEAARYTVTSELGEHQLSVVSMGNPHCVLEVDDTETANVEAIGPALESHADFPERVNVGFMQVLSSNSINLRVYERGVGETRACGTGACAAVVAGRRNDLLDDTVEVNLPGGKLTIEWKGNDQPVYMTGSASKVFEGKVRL